MGKSRKVVIPQFVADYIEEHREKRSTLTSLLTNDYYYMNKEIDNWLCSKDNQELLALAWIYKDYEIGKEKVYTAKLKSTGEYMCYDRETKRLTHSYVSDDIAKKSDLCHFTEQTLRKHFAWDTKAYEIDEV